MKVRLISSPNKAIIFYTNQFVFRIDFTFLKSNIWQTEHSLTRTTDPLSMSDKERYENRVRIFMERKGYKKSEIYGPLTDEKMRHIGFMKWDDYREMQRMIRKNWNPCQVQAVECGQEVKVYNKRRNNCEAEDK